MRRHLIAGLALAGLLGLTPATAQAPSGYLGAARWPDAAKILPPAPAPGSAREVDDQGYFRASRKLEGSPRWKMAQADVPTGPGPMMGTFACALGVTLTPQSAPRLAALLGRVGIDVGMQVASVKDVFKRKRPYLIEDGPICVPKSEGLAASPDYPSGHATWGWIGGLILADLAPDRATPILVRARAFGESRAVCGVHSISAVDAARTNASAIHAVLQSDATFRADLEAARAELARARAGGPTPDVAMCKAEAELAAAPLR
ncbi:phosphatase PAP2 family protein [Phenylobacterium sp.]|jgi:acid phosphatase (class A)|uniref:phosphatase PAP2 family protein n=1 Tax=Phenylobacterium sp. TaxID=1871053 RepID=UPI0037C8B941